MNVYNEIDPFAVQWLRGLIEAGHIADGAVERTGIEHLAAGSVRDATQAHFFAGVGVWSHALRRAGWPDDRPVWTGSCPCQPFSGAGAGKGELDARHLWPAWFSLIEECRPSIIFGEQVASPDGRLWLDAVSADLETLGYAVAAADLCAAGVGAPHIRQRVFWVAIGFGLGDADGDAARKHARELPRDESKHEVRRPHGDHAPKSPGGVRRMGDSDGAGSQVGIGVRGDHGEGWAPTERTSGPACGLADAESNGQNLLGGGGGEGSRAGRRRMGKRARLDGDSSRAGEGDGGWGNPDWVYCQDRVWRPVESGTSPLVNGVAGRVGRLRGYGNAIVGPLATVFIRSVMDILNPGRS